EVGADDAGARACEGQRDRAADSVGRPDDERDSVGKGGIGGVRHGAIIGVPSPAAQADRRRHAVESRSRTWGALKWPPNPQTLGAPRGSRGANLNDAGKENHGTDDGRGAAPGGDGVGGGGTGEGSGPSRGLDVSGAPRRAPWASGVGPPRR